jgi:protein involved in polysaccharide export with SLBB domain
MKRSQSSIGVTLVLLPLFGLGWSVEAQQPPPAATASGPSHGEYILQRGDDLEIRVYNMTELDGDVRVRPDGKISAVLLNDVQASGLTPLQLKQVLTEGYLAQNFRNPRITVIVKSSASQNVYVGGEIGLPAAVPLRGDLTAIQAVLHAGGAKEASASDQVTIRL